MTSAASPARALDPDTLAALEEQRDFLLGSLADLEREHEAGDVDDHDYATLKDDYTARAARTIRAIEAHQARVAAARPSRSWPRLVGTVAGVVAFAVVAGLLVAPFSGRREAGDALTGDIRESTRTQLDNARAAIQQERYDDAIEIYDDLLADRPDNVEALAYKGLAQIGKGDMQALVTLIDAAELDPDYPDTHYFLAGAFATAGRYETALEELDRFDALDPPPDLAAEADDLRARVQALEPLRGDERGGGRRTRVWVEGVDDPIVASRTERTILHDMGQDAASQAPIVDDALDLAERLVAAVDAGRVDLGDLGRRARRLLAATTAPGEV